MKATMPLYQPDCVFEIEKRPKEKKRLAGAKGLWLVFKYQDRTHQKH